MLTVFMFQMSSPSTIAMCSFRSKGEGDEKDEKVEVPQPELLAQNYSFCWRDRPFKQEPFFLLKRPFQICFQQIIKIYHGNPKPSFFRGYKL